MGILPKWYMAEGGARSAALLIGAGTNASPATDSGNGNFLDFRLEGTHTSGDKRGIYMRLFLAGVAGNGEAARFWTTVEGTGINSAHGAHITASVAVGGAISGLMAGVRATLDAAADTRVLTGTLAALQVDSNVGAGNTLPSAASMIRVAKAGSVDVTNLFDIADDQVCKGDATVGSADNALIMRMPDGSVGYLLVYPAA